MELRIDFPKLPKGLTLDDMKLELAHLLDEDGWLLTSGLEGEKGFLELELEDEILNPKHGILAVKHYLQKTGFDPATTIELAGVPVGIFE